MAIYLLSMTEEPNITVPPSRVNHRVLRWLGVWLLAVWTAAAIEPSYRQDWLLENILVFLSVLILLLIYSRLPFTTGTYVALTVFMTLHLIGAHYTYSETPIGDWLAAAFNWQRNHYDRIVHFSFGLLMAPAVRQIIRCNANAAKGWDLVLTAVVILGLSALFEIIEAATAMIVNPELGMAYLGTQGDVWDSQKDSVLALFGSVIFLICVALRRRQKTLDKFTQ